MSTELQFAKYFARQAGYLLQQYFRSNDFLTSTKPDQTAITEADIASDRLLTNAIQKYYPQDVLISEESQHTSFRLNESTPPTVWIIDPLDGTTNFSLGLPIWGVLIARLLEGQPDLAVLYFPQLNELYHAERGQGAFMNDAPIQVEALDNNRPFSFFACCSRTFKHYNVQIPYKARILGSAAYSICAVARGLAILGFEATPKIWDIAGAWLLLEEAGGFIQTIDASQPFPLKMIPDHLTHNYPTLAAATKQLLLRSQKQITLL